MRFGKEQSRLRYLSTIALSTFLVLIAGCTNINHLNDTPFTKGGERSTAPTASSLQPETNSSLSRTRQLKVTFIDVGQGDAILVQAPSGKTLLIDGGPKDAAASLVAALAASGIKRLDNVIATHEDADHIGSLDNAINTYPVGKVYLPKMPTKGTVAMKDFLTAVKSKGLSLTQAKAGVMVDLGTGVSALMVGPVKNHYEQDNNYSVVIKISYGQTSFLMTGDAESESEQDMLKSGANLKANVLKVGHHGSQYSTSHAFLAAVDPEYAVISVGHNNYGHPTPTVLNRLKAYGVKIFRTDQQGTIIAISDGNSIRFNMNPVSSELNSRVTSSAK